MKNLYNSFGWFGLAAFMMFFPISGFAKLQDGTKGKSEPIIRSIWKYEQDLSQYSFENGIAKKIYFLSLNSDGTYHQYVQVVPSNPQNFFRVRNYEISGKWSEKNGQLVLEEYGKENAIDYNYLYSHFENIDNQYITK
ncbi:MAG TPA: hypothetical protein PLA16_09475 [Chitinophagales bacterium]|jgi:hypothetical protein|nr:hypothetical protein [Chitinophagales bacterium]HPA36587.1 hypothetical protein [Chitinophagales bacterium]